jgi:hypothetical protein
MAKPKPYSHIKQGISHGQSIRLAVANKEQAIQRNEELKALGIAAEHPIRADGQLMPLVYRDRSARKKVAEAFDLPLEDY